MNRQFEDLAAAHLDDGLPVEAIRCLLQYSKSHSTIEKSRNIVSAYLWMNFGFNVTPDKKFVEQATGLIEIATTSLGGLSEQSTRHDVGPFRLPNYTFTSIRLTSALLDWNIFCSD